MEDPVEELSTDVLIAGGGVAGLRAAITAADSGCSVLLVQRGAAASPFLHAFNVAFAGGPAWDRPPVLFADMMFAGGFVNEPGLVALCSHCSEQEFRYFEKLGVPFVRKGAQLAAKGGQVRTLDNASLLRLLKSGDKVGGGIVWDDEGGRWVKVSAKAVVLEIGR